MLSLPNCLYCSPVMGESLKLEIPSAPENPKKEKNTEDPYLANSLGHGVRNMFAKFRDLNKKKMV